MFQIKTSIHSLVSAIKRYILSKMFTRCWKKVSAITNVHYKSVLYIEVFLWEFDRDTLLPDVRYIACPHPLSSHENLFYNTAKILKILMNICSSAANFIRAIWNWNGFLWLILKVTCILLFINNKTSQILRV